MPDGSPGGSELERPLFFSGGDGAELFGILTLPEAVANDIGVVLMTARGTYHRNRISVHLARRLARLGFHVIRFDFQGIGESTGDASFDPRAPLIDNVSGALGVLADRGVERFILMGSCFGASSALAAADTVDRLEGLVLAVMPFSESRSLPVPRSRHRLRRGMALARRALVDPGSLEVLWHVVRAGVKRRWSRFQERASSSAPVIAPGSRRVEGWLDRLVERQVPMLMLFGAEDAAYHDFHRATRSWPRSLQQDLDRIVEVRVASQHNIHGQASIEAQDWLLATVEEWVLGQAMAAGSAIPDAARSRSRQSVR